jgi:lysylphosphatidylglycerol synthetase-like protein (DUF2156 family)
MISIKKIMSVIAIAFAVMTIAGSGVYSFAQIESPCSATGASSLPGCGGDGIFKGFFNSTAKGASAINTVIGQVGSVLIAIIASISVIFLILGAVDMITDSGDGKKFSNGKQRITNAIIGLVVALLSFGIITVILNVVR